MMLFAKLFGVLPTKTILQTPELQGVNWTSRNKRWAMQPDVRKHIFRSARNTLWCLLGCAIGDLGAIALFERVYAPDGPPRELWTMVWIIAMGSGILTSVLLETCVLWRQLGPREAFRTAVGMSMVSMLLMEVSMNVADYGMMGKSAINLAILPVTLLAGFLAAWPYKYWRLSRHGKCCH